MCDLPGSIAQFTAPWEDGFAGRLPVSEVLQEHVDAPLLAELFPGEPVLAYFEFAPAQSDQSSRVVDDALKLAQAGVKIDPEELAEKTGYKLVDAGV